MTARSIGVQGRLASEAIVEIAIACEQAGISGLWLNAGPRSDSLRKAADALSATSRLRLGIGVVPVDQVSTAALAAEVEELGLPADRFLLGIGSGGAPHPVPLLRLAVDELKASCSVPIAVGALGPRVRRLAAEAADGIVLSWLTPEAARQARTDASAAAAEVARAAPRLVLYARTAVVAAARGALEEEAARYESYPAYRAHFERSGYRAMDAVIYATSPEDLGARISQYDEAVDELVARAITTDDSVAGIRAVVDAIAIS